MASRCEASKSDNIFWPNVLWPEYFLTVRLGSVAARAFHGSPNLGFYLRSSALEAVASGNNLAQMLEGDRPSLIDDSDSKPP